MANTLKRLKILGLETHQRKLRNGKWSTSGVDWARIIQPLQHLANHPDFEVEIRKEPFTKKEKNWNEITKAWDIIWTSYIDEPIGYVQMAFWGEKNNCKIVADIDDNVWQLDPANPVFNSYHPGSEKLHTLSSIMEHVEWVTVSTMPLKRTVVRLNGRKHDKTIVLPNYIDLTAYDIDKTIKNKKDKLTILHAGSSTHFKDLTEGGFVSGMTRILKENPHVEFVTIGNWIPQLQTLWGPQYRQIMGKPDVYEWISDLWPKIIGMTDITVAPLKDDPHTRCKSGIKFLEFSAGKVPGVYQDMDQYRDHLLMSWDRGLLAGDWFTQLNRLVKDEKLRLSMGQKAYEYVKDNHTIQGNIDKHAEFFKGVVG